MRKDDEIKQLIASNTSNAKVIQAFSKITKKN